MQPVTVLPCSQVPATCFYPVHAFPTCFLVICVNISLPFSLCLQSGLFTTGFPTKTLYSPLLYLPHAPPISFVIWCVHYEFSVTSFLLGPHILLHTLVSNTLSQCSSLNVKAQDSRPSKTRDILRALCIFFVFG